MRTERQFKFSISIDDEAIRERVMKHAYDDVIKKLMAEAKSELRIGESKYRYDEPKDSWRTLIGREMGAFIESNKTEIIDLAAEKLADSYKRTKAFKEKMGAATDDIKVNSDYNPTEFYR